MSEPRNIRVNALPKFCNQMLYHLQFLSAFKVLTILAHTIIPKYNSRINKLLV